MEEVKNVLVKHYAGSLAYGTNTPESDVDFRGLFYTDAKQLYSPYSYKGEMTDSSEEDTKFYELRKYINLYTKGNPNIIETLWVDPSDITYKTNIYDELRSYRKELLCSKVAFTYSGYAAAQFSKMRNHHEHMIQKVERPEQIDFMSVILNVADLRDKFSLRNYLYGYRLVKLKAYIYGLYEDPGHVCWNTRDGSLKKENPSGEFYNEPKTIWDSILGIFNKSYQRKKLPLVILKYNDKEYTDAFARYEGLKSWEKNRNPKRHETELIHGYDTKNAMHLVRLIRTGEEILKTGEVLVKRPDAEELLAIRNGLMSYEDLEAYFMEKDKYIRTVLYRETELPHDINFKLANDLSYELHDLIYRNMLKNTTGI